MTAEITEPRGTDNEGDLIYYADQSDWNTDEFGALWRYLNRLFQSIPAPHPNPTTGRVGRAARLSHQIQARKVGRRDDELAAIDLARVWPTTKHLMRHMLIRTHRLEPAMRQFPNLRELGAETHLGSPLVLTTEPTYTYDYYSKVGIIL